MHPAFIGCRNYKRVGHVTLILLKPNEVFYNVIKLFFCNLNSANMNPQVRKVTFRLVKSKITKEHNVNRVNNCHCSNKHFILEKGEVLWLQIEPYVML